jgi:hypothetical protein
MATYSFSHGPNTLTVTLSGSFDQPQAEQYVKDFQAEVAKIQPSKTEMRFLASEHSIVGANMQQDLIDCLNLYKSFGFKKVVVDFGSNVIMKMQAKRLASSIGFPNLEII